MTLTYPAFTATMGNGVVAVAFNSKPSDAALKALKANGFRWQPIAKEWRGKVYAGVADLLAWLGDNA